MLLGITLGVIIGVLPGLGGANGIAILLPLTFSMSPTSAIIMLSCIYWGALFGGAITSTLFNIPGEPWSVATTFDGYPMAQQGRAGEALTGAFTSSFVGALVAVLVGGLTLYAWPHFQLRQTSYATEQMAREKERLIEENRKLRLEKATLENLRRVETIAVRDLGLEAPPPERVVVVESAGAVPEAGRVASQREAPGPAKN